MGSHEVALDAIAGSLRERGLIVGVAESLTCGLLAAALGKGPHARDWLAGGVVAYTPEVKQAVLGVSRGPVVTARCAEEMARGAASVLGADIAVSTTGVGGPEPEEGHPSGTVYIGWSRHDRAGSERHRFDGPPEAVLDQTVGAALGVLLRLCEPHDGW